jgi:hypothetical protein
MAVWLVACLQGWRVVVHNCINSILNCLQEQRLLNTCTHR